MVRTLSEVKNSPGIPGLFWIQGDGLVDGFCSDYDANKPSACRAGAAWTGNPNRNGDTPWPPYRRDPAVKSILAQDILSCL